MDWIRSVACWVIATNGQQKTKRRRRRRITTTPKLSLQFVCSTQTLKYNAVWVKLITISLYNSVQFNYIFITNGNDDWLEDNCLTRLAKDHHHHHHHHNKTRQHTTGLGKWDCNRKYSPKTLRHSVRYRFQSGLVNVFFGWSTFKWDNWLAKSRVI